MKHIFDKRLTAKIYKEHLKVNNEKTNNPVGENFRQIPQQRKYIDRKETYKKVSQLHLSLQNSNENNKMLMHID